MKTKALIQIISPIMSGSKKPWIPLSWVDFMQDPQRSPSVLFRCLDACIDGKWICPIRIQPGDDAYYSISKDEIVVPPKDSYPEESDFYANLLHEMTHSTGSEKYLQRIIPFTFDSSSFATEELISELTAAMVAACYSVPKHFKSDSIAYCETWLDKLAADPTYAETVFSHQQEAADLIIMKLKQIRETL